ncbi:MAG: hypothetical protein JNL32_12550 [Candidatus Kapabacteria bacterium]|nr:hypothetical protein [Candidatus Kapabacteria bacterium]
MNPVIRYAVLVICTLTAPALYANPNGQFFNKSGGCGCHNENITTATTTTVTPSRTNVPPGGKIDFVLSVQNATRPKAGFGIVVSNEAFTAPVGKFTHGSDCHVISNQLVHNEGKVISGTPREATWSFSWTAPATPGTYFVYAIGNAVTNAVSGDWRYITPLQINVGTSSAETDTGDEMLAYPNPVFSQLTVPVPESWSGGTLSIHSTEGSMLYREESIGNAVQWDTRTPDGEFVPSGVYYIVLERAQRRRILRVSVVR